jgi:dihydropteroate synthase
MLTLENLAELLNASPDAASVQVREFAVGSRNLPFNTRAAIMGVVNLSPDSWYRESVCLTAAAAIERARVLHAQGADLVDIGAESTLANAARADAGAQTQKLLPILQELRQSGIPVSIETYSPTVAAACLEAGAAVLNLTGPSAAEEMYRMVAHNGAAVIICYVQGPNVREVGDFDLSRDPIDLMHGYFARQIDAALHAGATRIFVDPGLGFYYRNLQDSALRIRHQMRVFLNSFRLRTLGFPVCHALPHAFEFFREEVRCAEPFFALLALLGKTDLLRTHEVPRVKAVLETLQAW